MFDLIEEDESFLDNMTSEITLKEYIDIHNPDDDDDYDIEDLYVEEFLSLRSSYNRITHEDASIKEFYRLYQNEGYKLRYLIDHKNIHHMIARSDYDSVSRAYDSVCEDHGIDPDDSDSDEETDRYELVYELLKDWDILNSDDDDD